MAALQQGKFIAVGDSEHAHGFASSGKPKRDRYPVIPQEPQSTREQGAGRTVNEYGACDLKRRYRSYVSSGLALSLLLHICLVGAYWAYVRLAPQGTQTNKMLIVTYAELGPPPSIRQSLTTNLRVGNISTRRLDLGIPVPVPDVRLKVEKTFPTQEELSEIGNASGDGATGGINIPDSVRAEQAGDDLEGITPDNPPVLLKMAVPRYPDAALRAKVSGTVWVRVLVDERGAVKSVNVQRSDAPILNQAALEAARKCTFTPGMYRKRTIASWVSIPIEFKLEQD